VTSIQRDVPTTVQKIFRRGPQIFRYEVQK
jgi:hypothetical protein